MAPPGLDEILPGLFISDKFSAGTAYLLTTRKIRYVLSVCSPTILPSFPEVNGKPLITKSIDIDDDPFEDLLADLNDACDWIDQCIAQKDGGVLVHCLQGISRSGSVVVAYLMRTLKVPYDEALARTRLGRPLISPNNGFKAQLLVVGRCGYEIRNKDGSDKAEYAELKQMRQEKLRLNGEDLDKERYASMAAQAASLGTLKGEQSDEEVDKAGRGEKVAGSKNDK